MAAFETEVAFIAVRQDFAGTQPHPTITLPAFTSVFELTQLGSMRRELRRTIQGLVVFLNLVGSCMVRSNSKLVVNVSWKWQSCTSVCMFPS